MAYVTYDLALTPDESRVVPVKQFAPTLQKALAAAGEVLAQGGFFNLRVEAEDGHTLFNEAEIRARFHPQARSGQAMPLAAAAAPA